MRVDGHVSCRSTERFSLSIGDVDFCFWVSVLFCHAEIDDVDQVGVFTAWSTDKKVVWFDVAIYKVLFMYCLDSGNLPSTLNRRREDHLLGDHADCFLGESPLTIIEQVFQTWSK